MAPAPTTRPDAGRMAMLLVFAVAALGAAFALGRMSKPKADNPTAQTPGKAADAGAKRGRPNAAFGGPGGRPPPIALTPVELAPVVSKVEAVGAGRARQSVALNAEVSGLVAKVHIRAGAQVKAGSPILSLVDDAERIALAKARADYAIADTNRKRYAELYGENAASNLEYETSRNTYAAAKAALDQAQYNLDRRTIRAPFDGALGLITLDPGDYLQVGAQVTTIDDLSALLVDFVVPERYASQIRPGLAFDAALDAEDGRTVKGVVKSVDSRIDTATRTRKIEASIDNSAGALLPGATFAISLVLPSRQTPAVPGLAVLYDRAGPYVWRRDGKGMAERVPVTIIERTADNILVDGPLKLGDLVVSEGADIVRPGAPLVDRTRLGGDADGGAAALK